MADLLMQFYSELKNIPSSDYWPPLILIENSSGKSLSKSFEKLKLKEC